MHTLELNMEYYNVFFFLNLVVLILKYLKAMFLGYKSINDNIQSIISWNLRNYISFIIIDNENEKFTMSIALPNH